MSELQDAFGELMSEHRRIGSPVPDYLVPGKPAGEVRQRLTIMGFDPADDVVEYFTLQNGIDDTPWFHVGSGLASGSLYLYPVYESPGLEQLERIYQDKRQVSQIHGTAPRRKADIPEVAYWARTWLPVFVGDRYSVGADCRGGSISVVWGQASHPGSGPTAPLHQTLADFIRDVANRLRVGAIWWTEKGYDWDLDRLLKLDDQLAAAARSFDPYDLY